MCMLCAAMNPDNPAAATITHAPAGASYGGFSVPGTTTPTPVVSTLDALATQLTTGYWAFNGEGARSFALGPDRQITVNLSGLDSAAQYVARAALSAWSDVTGITFVDSVSAQITFDDSDSGAYSYSNLSGKTIIDSFVNVESTWDSDPVSLNSYWFQTYLHEIGHALGLGHAGNYNGSAIWGVNNKFANDSWQASVMSYFAQTENPNTGGASYAFTATAMAADIIAIQSLYGANVQTRTGDTVYGSNSNVDGYLGDLFDQWLGGSAAHTAVFINNPITMTLFDTGGIDTLDVSGSSAAQRIDLNAEAKSNVAGLIGNIIIARGTVIENAIGGAGNDTLFGNAAANTLSGGEGADSLDGRTGNDALFGGGGNDTLLGGTGADTLAGGAGTDKYNGGSQFDFVSYAGSTGALVVDLTTQSLNAGDAAGETFTGVEGIIGGSGADILRGAAAAEILRGMDGADNLLGRSGNDTLDGGADNDALAGGRGNDILIGGLGDDLLSGNAGADTFVFNGGNDTVTDFINNIDTLSIAQSLFGLATVTVAEALAFAVVEGGNIVFHFNEIDSLTLTGFTSIAALQDDLIFA